MILSLLAFALAIFALLHRPRKLRVDLIELDDGQNFTAIAAGTVRVGREAIGYAELSADRDWPNLEIATQGRKVNLSSTAEGCGLTLAAGSDLTCVVSSGMTIGNGETETGIVATGLATVPAEAKPKAASAKRGPIEPIKLLAKLRPDHGLKIYTETEDQNANDERAKRNHLPCPA